MRILSGDIGGTKTRLAIFESDNVTHAPLIEKTYPSADYDSLDRLVGEFLHVAGIDGCARACFGIAGPVSDGRCSATNLPWVVDAVKLAADHSFQTVDLINDLEANAWGISALGKDDFQVLNEGVPTSAGNTAVIAAGTGLGEAGMFWDGTGHRPFATEGGHADFSPGSSLERALLEYLAKRLEHVSWERVLSGPGLINLYEFLCDYHRYAAPGWLREQMRNADPAAAISRTGMEGRCTVCAQALDLFVHLYGVEAGNLALKLMATGGVYIGGGIAPKILPRLEGPAFMHAFTAKGRMRPLLESIPVKIILNDRTALFGPAVYAARRL